MKFEIEWKHLKDHPELMDGRLLFIYPVSKYGKKYVRLGRFHVSNRGNGFWHVEGKLRRVELVNPVLVAEIPEPELPEAMINATDKN